jgi:hypothetical protein
VLSPSPAERESRPVHTRGAQVAPNELSPNVARRPPSSRQISRACRDYFRRKVGTAGWLLIWYTIGAGRAKSSAALIVCERKRGALWGGYEGHRAPCFPAAARGGAWRQTSGRRVGSCGRVAQAARVVNPALRHRENRPRRRRRPVRRRSSTGPLRRSLTVVLDRVRRRAPG